MPTPEEHRVTREIFRLVDGAKLRFLQGVDFYKLFDDQGDNEKANDVIKKEADTVIRFKNRIGNAVVNLDLDIPACITFYGYSLSDLRSEMTPIVTVANQVINNYPNVTRAQVDNINIRKPELVNNLATKEI